MLKIDLNCDLGEGMLTDEAIMPYISSANIACGAHAGDENTIKRTIALCLEHNVAIGAHPGFADKNNFGRISVKLSPAELYELFYSQIVLVKRIAANMGATLHHVKPHGALYNMAATDNLYAQIVVQATNDADPTLIFYGLSNSCMTKAATLANIKTANEVFADRTYQEDGTLTPRNKDNALIADTNIAVEQALQLITRNNVNAVSGKAVPVKADTICLHGDGVHAVEFARMIYERLQKENIKVETI